MNPKFNIIFLIIISSCSNNSSYSNEYGEKLIEEYGQEQISKSPEELREELKQLEENAPLDYLTVEATMTPNIIQTQKSGLFKNAKFENDGYFMDGVISNKATLAKYKDIVLNISYISKTGTVLEETKEILYEFYEPNSESAFFLHLYPPAETYEFNVYIKGATRAK
jgi:hypothetical protein